MIYTTNERGFFFGGGGGGGGGGELNHLGGKLNHLGLGGAGEASPLSPYVDRTLIV